MEVVSSVRCQWEIKMAVESDKHRYTSLDMDTWTPSSLITDIVKFRDTLCGEICGHLFDFTFQS